MTGSRSLTFSTSRRPARRRGVRVGLVAVAVVLVVAALAALIAGALWSYGWARLGGQQLASLSATGEDALGAGGATSPAGTTTVLVALTEPTEQDAPTPVVGPVALVQAGGPRGQDPAVILLPPGLQVSVAGQPTMALADVHATGGAELLLRTVVDYTQIAVDHVAIASADALPRLLEVRGPVEVCTETCVEVTAEQVASQVATYTAIGTAPADAAAALTELAAVLRGLGASADGLGAITSPLETKRTIDVVADDVVTDVGLRGAALLPVADRLAAAGPVSVATLPGVVNPDTGEVVLLPEQAAARFAVLREGGLQTTTSEDDEADLLGAATVSVQNGTGTAGYAASLETRLAALGVRVVGTENAASFDVERTEVRFAADDPTAEATAIVLARALGDAALVPVERELTFEGEPVTVQVVGGADLDTGADTPDDQEP